MASNYVEEQSEDLSTCCVCLEFYDVENRKPKFLTCHHTLCLNCIITMLASRNRLVCPKCKMICTVPTTGPERLFTNMYALTIIELWKNNRHQWCLKCLAVPKSNCFANHSQSIADCKEDIKQIKKLQLKLFRHLEASLAERNKLQVGIMEALKRIKKIKDENSTASGALRSLIQKCNDGTILSVSNNKS